MNDLIKYLDTILNIKLDNDFSIADIEEHLSKVNDIIAYRSYVRDNMKRADIEFKSGFQKYIILTDEFLEMEENSKLSGVKTKAEIYAKTVADKVEQCRNVVEDNNVLFRQIKKDGEMLFEIHELNCLAGIGSTSVIIEYSRMCLLEGMINEYYLKSFKKKKAYEHLTEGQKRVQALIGDSK